MIIYTTDKNAYIDIKMSVRVMEFLLPDTHTDALLIVLTSSESVYRLKYVFIVILL